MPPANRAPRGGHQSRALAAELSAFDALEVSAPVSRRLASSLLGAAWPKLTAVGVVLTLWQLVALSGWRPAYLLPPPADAFAELAGLVADGSLAAALATTLQRAAIGFAIAIGVGLALGVAVSRWRLLRSAVGSLVTGLQTMPSIAWFPLAILLFGLTDVAITFVVVLGAAPAIANGLIAGIDNVPPILLRAGRVLGAAGLGAYRHVILPAALPSFVGGLKQGWAFAWRSLMAGELLVIIGHQPSIGARLQFARELSDAAGLVAMMLVVLTIGIVVDIVLFGALERHVRARWGLLDAR
jgi:NitT/TauT family transport system permease protein